MEAISFVDWIIENMVTYTGGINNRIWTYKGNDYTTEELYNVFKKENEEKLT